MPDTLTKPTSTGKHVAICGAASRRDGKLCLHEAGWGTSHPGFGFCKMHGGSHRNGEKHAAKIQVQQMAQVMGVPLDVDPTVAILNAISIVAGEVEYATLMVAALNEDQAVETFGEETISDGGRTVKTTNVATLNVWIRTRHEAMDRLVRYAKTAIDAGVAERQVRVAEQMGGMLGKLITAVLGELSLSPAQLERAPGVVQRQLALVAGQAAS